MRSLQHVAVLSSLFIAVPIHAFTVHTHKHALGGSLRPVTRPLAASSRSRLEGNQRDPTVEELAIMDQMIDKLAQAKPYELPNAVRRAFRVISSPQFFLRIASRADQATAAAEKERYEVLASNLISTLDAVVSTTEDQLDERAKQVERVVQAAAEPDSGEFLVPLIPERIQAMQEQLQSIEESSLDEGFLNTLDSWIVKSHQDGMDLMIGILQKVLQMYAGLQIQRARERQKLNESGMGSPSGETTSILTQLLQTDADQWDLVLSRHNPAVLKEVLSEVQRTTESIVFALEAGSMAQRVQAEYMQELMKRVESAIARKQE